MGKMIDLESDLVPIGRFKAQAASVLKSIGEQGRTVVITQNGIAAAVMMSPREYDQIRYRQKFVEEIAQALADVDEGATQTSAQVRKALAARRRGTRKK